MARQKLLIEVDLEGAALADDATGVYELRDILQGIGDRADLLWGAGGWKNDHGITIADSNGNRVGQAEIRRIEST